MVFINRQEAGSLLASSIRFSAFAFAEVKMKKARFTETQIVNILKLADSGLKIMP
ncbi:hypothetical protein [uncultured Cedecea sp.]|uniref:hypothetical protein n=1 Tax=uncultured Cedecea sp. TaxID=988762 RepID=UPI002608E66B|nr:hypothetical protein [uncultured Cedecea sp.]